MFINLISDTDTINPNVEQTLEFLYLQGFKNSDRINSYVVAVTNNLIYFWNKYKITFNLIHIFIIANCQYNLYS
jgi:hypothetical protein